MSKQLFEIDWIIMTDVSHFLKTSWKVFDSEDEARAYGLLEELGLNDGLPLEEKLDDGFCYKFLTARQLETVDGYPIWLMPQVNE